MNGFLVNIEQATENNNDYRRVLYTASNSQLVVMSLGPGEEIGEEIHEVDQFIRVEEGDGAIVLNGERHHFGEDEAVVIPAGVRHNVINTGDEPLKLYSLYSPPHHKDGTIHPTKAQEAEEHFDGKTTESS